MKNKLKKSILLMALAMATAAPTIQVHADTAVKGCKGVPVNMYISPNGSSDLNFQCSDNCGFKIEKTGNSSVSVGGFSSTSDIYSVTFYVPGLHTVRATDNSGTLVKTEIYEISDGHSYGNPTEWKKVSCTTDGLLEYTCQNCRERKEETVPATGHNFWSWTVAVKPTALREGREQRICRTCFFSEKRVLEKLPASVTLAKTSITLKAGKTYKLSVKKLTTGDSAAKWASSNKKIASVTGSASRYCIINTKKSGKAKVTVTMRSGCKATCTVTVK